LIGIAVICDPEATFRRRGRPWRVMKGGGGVAWSADRIGPGGCLGDAELERLIADRGSHLMCAAIALAGSRQRGEDLLQAAIERLLRHRRRVGSNPEGYLRRTLYNLAADDWRQRGRRRGRLPLLYGQGTNDASIDAVSVVDLRDALVRALAELPPRQRAVLVLRYWEQLTEAETAAMLGCSEGTVKSAASRGLRRLRELAATWDEAQGQLTRGRSWTLM
jgi:RNA polymerase sigma-70 factor (sigma-E family)